MTVLTPVGAEVPVNSTTTSDQVAADVTVLGGGQTVAAFLDSSSGSSVAKVRLFDDHQNAVSAEITLGSASGVQTAAMAGGGFAVTWIETTATNSIVHSEVFDATGHAVGGVNDLATYNGVLDVQTGLIQTQFPLGLHMTSLFNGDVAVSWTVQTSDLMAFKSVFGQMMILDQAGQPDGSYAQTLAASSKSLTVFDGAVTPVQLPNGDLMLTWHQNGIDLLDPNAGQYVQLFTQSGEAIGSPMHLDAAIPLDGGPLVDATIGSETALPNGDIVFTWVGGSNVYVSLYPEDQLGLGINNGRTPPQVVGEYLGGGSPQAVTLSDGSFAIVWAGSGDGTDVLARVYSSDGTAQGAAFHLGVTTAGTQDSPFVAANGDGLSTIWTDGSHTTDPSGTGVDLQIYAGVETPHVLSGTSGDDLLAGGSGQDWILGHGGEDTVSGGAGVDKFIFTEGATGTAHVLDFQHGSDLLLLFNAQGQIADGSHGLLILDQASHTLSWDPDSDAGATPPQTLAVLDGVTSLDRSDFAAGFHPSALRVLLAGGASQEFVFDWGTASWEHTQADISPTGAVLEYQVFNDDGSHWAKWFDQDSFAWSSLVAEWDPSGALTRYTAYYDNGLKEQFTFDPHNTEPWQRIVEDYDVTGQLTQRFVVNDDGTIIAG